MLPNELAHLFKGLRRTASIIAAKMKLILRPFMPPC